MEESYVQMQTAIRAIPVLSQKQQEIIQDIVQISRQNLYCNLTNADLADRHGCSTDMFQPLSRKQPGLVS